MAVDGCVPSNKEQGYVMRRLLRRAIRYSFDLGIEQNFLEEVVPVIADLYEADFPEVKENREQIIAVLVKEEKAFRQTLRKGLKQMQQYIDDGLTGEELFTLYDTFGFPVELSTEEAYKQGIKLSDSWRAEFDARMAEQRQRSKTARKGQFSGGLEGHDGTLHSISRPLWQQGVSAPLSPALGNASIDRIGSLLSDAMESTQASSRILHETLKKGIGLPTHST